MNSASSARRVVTLGVILFAVAGGPGAASAPSETRTTDITSTVDAAAGALVAARRVSFDDLAVFPMQPTPLCNILDNFGDPRSGGRRHEGSDMLATLGQQVYAASDGTLTLQVVAGTSSPGANLSGNLWSLTAANGTYYVYAHLSAFAAGLQRGSLVKRGQLIGYVGDTGNPGAGNYHLHFEIHPGGGAAVNPLPLLVIPRECSVS